MVYHTECEYRYLGRVDYQTAWDLQRRLAELVAGGKRGPIVLLLEHPPTYTLGRRSKPEDLLLPAAALEARGAAVVDVDRGGKITFHGPGQLVGYPLLDLRRLGLGPLAYVRALEDMLITVASAYGVEARCIQGLTGVWVGDAKLAAIGVRISRGVSTHGFALNVNTDLSWFGDIVPCGIADKGVTSLERLLGRAVSLGEVAHRVASAVGERLGLEMRCAPAAEEEGAWWPL